MIVRVWRATVLSTKEAEYDDFARQVSQPMFERQEGFRGVLFARDGERCIVVTLWSDLRDLDSLAASQAYRDAVERITPLLGPDTTTEVYKGRGGTLPAL
ncbi:antibiotic biosynthesis monooxygenase [Streptomyces sp. NPDC088752]|uniref:antibiotic biosynthesis monooxygenase family protein n=1 Tax=Streptomyces sp. NPDC088752 TaxID=3154963 RepID=UPI00341BC4FB